MRNLLELVSTMTGFGMTSHIWTFGNKARDIVLPDVALREVQEFIANRLSGKSVRVYEAGGGSLSVLPLSSMNHPTITVVDIEEIQLRKNSYAHVKVLGDIQTYAFTPNSFDLIVCYNVIEHLNLVDQAIRQFHSALAPGGLLFIGAPNPESLFGLVTKYSPHWFHVWVYRVIMKHKDAGKPGQLPFRTIYHPLVSPKALMEFCAQIGFKVIYYNLYMSGNYIGVRRTRPVIGWLLGALISLMNAFTLGRVNLARGDYHVVLEKPVLPAIS
jgi:2-polyprenyl-3-methyl-5-hydroxy-6-metoxy-1,4-benzoquinol methylase